MYFNIGLRRVFQISIKPLAVGFQHGIPPLPGRQLCGGARLLCTLQLCRELLHALAFRHDELRYTLDEADIDAQGVGPLVAFDLPRRILLCDRT